MTSLETWERKYYVAGGEAPFIFYVVYGDVDFAAPLSRGTYRSNGAPDGVDVMHYGPSSHPDVPSMLRQGFVWNEFVADDPDLSEIVAQANHGLVLRGSPTDSTTLDYLRDIVGLISHYVDHGGCAVFDPMMFRWWRPEDWKQEIFGPGAAVPHNHTVILVSEEDDSSLSWFHTRGMRKFGRPDVSVHDVSSELEDGVIDLCNRLIEHQAFGLIVPDGQQVKMDSLPSGGVINHGGTLEDPDFNNFHLAVTWPTARGGRVR